jgi:hypothetical protein
LVVLLVREPLPKGKTLEQEDGPGNPVIRNAVCTRNKISDGRF